MANIPSDHEATVQIVLGASYSPSPTPQHIADPHASWVRAALIGDVSPASNESMKVIRDKVSCHGFNAVIRVGVSAIGTAANTYGASILSALRTMETVGVKISTVKEDSPRMNWVHIPWSFPLRLSVKELANFLMIPIGEMELPGVAGLHPKQVPAPKDYFNPYPIHDRSFAVSSDGRSRLSISSKDSLEHTILLGPTGSGKSTAMLHMILKDIKAGRSVLVIDPKSDLITNILKRMPHERDDDVVIIDPSDSSPVGFNPFAFTDYRNPTLVTDAILSVFKEVFKENWGIRSQDVLSAAFLTLAQTKGASLLWLPTLLTDEAFRRKVTSGINDKIGLEPFWEGFEEMKDSERRAEIAPVLNKVRQFLLRPGLRNVLGQANPKFSLTDLFYKRKIVLVPLNKAIIGAESAGLLGSLIVGLTWTLALTRANVPPEQRHTVSVFVDELQDYLKLSTDLSDALAQARGLGLSLTLAHQYRTQLQPEIRAAVDANARNKVVFGVDSNDAKDMAAMAPNLEPVDFMTLPRYHIYTKFNYGGKSSDWVSGKTLPEPPVTRDEMDLRGKSMTAYGETIENVESEYLEILASSRRLSPDDHDCGGTDYGREKICRRAD
jgi:hypothetical protein